MKAFALITCAVTLACTSVPAVPSRVVDGQAAPPPPEFVVIDRRLDSLVTAGVVPSVAVAVASRGSIVWETAYGYADRASRARATARTIYPLASVSKSITATAVMLLAERGVLDLDKPVRAYLGADAPRVHTGDATKLTARVLLQMTGGVPHLWHHYWTDDVADSLDDARLVRQFGFSAFPPGEHFMYSNMSFGILQFLVSRVSGKSFDRFVREDVMAPLGLRHTAVHMQPHMLPFAATLYDRQRETAPVYSFLDPQGGAWSLSSAHDLAVFGSALSFDSATAGPQLLSDRTLRDMFATPAGHVYSLGWWRVGPAGFLTALADGQAYGATATLKVLPELGVVAVALVNQAVSGDFTTTLVDELIAAMVREYRVQRLEPPESFRSLPLAGSAEWEGTWKGVVAVDTATVPVLLKVGATGVTSIKLGADSARPVQNPSVTGGLLEGAVDAMLPASVARLAPHELTMRVRVQRDTIVGYLLARSTASRLGFGLPFFLRLTREQH